MRSVADRMENAPESAPDWSTLETTSKADIAKALRSVGLIEALQKKGEKLAKYATHLYEDGRM